jgi:probable rRNA maturation factor
MEIAIKNECRTETVKPAILQRRVKKLLSALGFSGRGISITLVDDAAIRAINKKWLGRDKTTNVISFGLEEGEFPEFSAGLLGEVVVSLTTARKEAEGTDLTYDEYLTRLIIHGVLHLTGYNHEGVTAAKADEMEKKTGEMMRLLFRAKKTD